MTDKQRMVLMAVLWAAVTAGAFALGAYWELAAFFIVKAAGAVLLMILCMLGMGAFLGLLLFRRPLAGYLDLKLSSFADGILRILGRAFHVISDYLGHRQYYSNLAVSRCLRFAGRAWEYICFQMSRAERVIHEYLDGR